MNRLGATATERPPAHAGTFYPASPDALSQTVARMLAQAASRLDGELRGIVVPHAGYVYSGGVAAHAYRLLGRRQYDTVLLLGPSHYHRFPGVALQAAGSFRTPLGRVPVDADTARALLDADALIQDLPEVHVQEHCLEVQLPFLQRVLPPFSIVPILTHDFGDANCRRLADALAHVIEARNALLVTTTDLAHYPAHSHAVDSDTAMIEATETFDPSVVRERNEEYLSRRIPNLHVTMCGMGAVISAMEAMRARGANRVQTLKYANSGDVPGGSKTQVVGYVASAFVESREERRRPIAPEDADRIEVADGAVEESPDVLGGPAQAALLRLARETITRHVSGRQPQPAERLGLPADVADALQRKHGAFVTLRKGGKLRGCIGHIAADRPLVEVVQEMAIAAATQDPRFPRVLPGELDAVQIEVSVLTAPCPVRRVDDVEVGRHGLIVRRGRAAGLLLPQVAVEQGWDREQFLEYTCLKAGLPPTAYRQDGTTVEVFQAQVFHETQPTGEEQRT
jgi:AmmeMemoRadiSam system protein B/AmmeMemoRadiSam system protein A